MPSSKGCFTNVHGRWHKASSPPRVSLLRWAPPAPFVCQKMNALSSRDVSAASQGHAVCASPSFTGSLKWRRAGFNVFLFNWAMPWRTLRPQLSVRARGIGGTQHDKKLWIPNFLVSLRTNILKYASLLAEIGEKIHSYGKLAQKYFK